MQKIHQAAQSGNLKLLQVYASRGLKLDASNKEKWNALHFAVIGGHSDVVKFLIDKNLSVNTCTVGKVSPLHLAAQTGDEFITTLLVENGAILDAQDANGRTPLHYAVSNESLACVRFLINFKAATSKLDNEGSSPLHMAVSAGNFEITRILLDNGCSPCICYTPKRVHMHQPVMYWSPLHLAAESENLEMMKLLLSYGADANIANNADVSPLHVAAEKMCPDMITLLKDNKADDEFVDKDKETPLFLAVRKRIMENVKLLTTSGTIWKKNVNERNVLHEACIYGYDEIVEFLLTVRFDDEASDSARLHFVVDNLGNTPLHYAVMNKHKECVRILLEHGADIMVRNDENQSPYTLSTGEITGMMKRHMETNRHKIDIQPMNKTRRSTKAPPSKLKTELSPKKEVSARPRAPDARLGQRPHRRDDDDGVSTKSVAKSQRKVDESPESLKKMIEDDIEGLKDEFYSQIETVRQMIEDLRADMMSEE